MAKPCRVIVSPQLAEVLNLEPNQDLSYREWVQILHDGGLNKLTEKAFVAIQEAKAQVKAEGKPTTQEESEQKSMNEPRNAKDVALIFRKLFNFSPFESVVAARLFDAKAAFMSRVKGISKEDYYKQYWLAKEQEGGLSQMTLPDGRKVTVKKMSPEVVNGFYSPIEKNLMDYGKDKIKAKDWLNVVGKSDEAVFTGVRAFLEGKDPNAMISKQEILDYMKDNRISVSEVVKSDEPKMSDAKARDIFENQGYDVVTDSNGDTYVEKDDELYEYDDMSPLEQEAFEVLTRNNLDTGRQKQIKFSQYQLEGEKENYKEVLVTLPYKNATVKKVEDANRWEVIMPDGTSKGTYYSESEAQQAAKFETRQAAKFKSSHFDEPNILVHLRMNTRTDAEGNKVLFLEEVQSDWGQEGKKKGFAKSEKEIKDEYEKADKAYDIYLNEIETKYGKNFVIEDLSKSEYDKYAELANKRANLGLQIDSGRIHGQPTAPFVTDTNAWTKLGLKVALKEAVAQGVDKIAWTTGEQQNERYDLSKQVDEIQYLKNDNGTYLVHAIKGGERIESKSNLTEKDLEGMLGKDVAKRIVENEGLDIEVSGLGGYIPAKSLRGQQLSVGGKGMKGFYGSIEEGTKGIVGGVAEKLFGQKVGETKIETASMMNFEVAKNTEDIKRLSKSGNYTFMENGNPISKSRAYELIENGESVEARFTGKTIQPSIDITPELKAQVEEGLPLFQGDRKGAWSKEAAKAKRIISMYTKADSTTQVHEVIGHDYLDEIIQAAETNEEFANDLNTIVDEFIKETGSKVSKEKLLNDLKNFDVEKNQNTNGKNIHEWFAKSAERYFGTERGAQEGKGFSKKIVALFEKFRQHIADLYSKMNKELVEPSPAMKEVFRKIFGAENFAEAEEMRKATFERMNSLEASELEKNRSNKTLEELLDKYKPKEGLGQLSDDFKQDMSDIASRLVESGKAQRYNVTDKMQELMPHLKNEIEQLRKSLQTTGTKGTLRQGVENLLANPNISPEIKEKIQRLGEYTPEKMAQVGLNAEQILSFYAGEKGNDIDGMAEVAKMLDAGKFDGMTEKVALRQLLIANYNQLAKIAKTKEAKENYLNLAVDQAEKYSLEGTGLGRMVNMYKAIGSLTSDGIILWAKRREQKFAKKALKNLKDNIADLKEQLKKAADDIDYFLSEVSGKEETIEKLHEEIADLEKQIEAAKKARGKSIKDKAVSAYRRVKNAGKPFSNNEVSNLINDFKGGKLYQDVSNLTTAQKLAYHLMVQKPMNISQFAKAFSKLVDQKFEPSELKELYQQSRDFLITQDIGYAEGLSANQELEKDLKDLEDTKRAKIESLERKKREREAKLAEKKAMKTQMAEKDKEVRAKEELKKREKEIRDSFLNSLSKDGLWQQYVKSAAGRLMSNLGSKMGVGSNEKALLDKFTQLATTELNKAIDELIPKQKGKKGETPNYPQQLADLIKNQEKLADIFDKAVSEFAENNKGNVNAQNIISKLNGLKNPFSENLMEKALENEAKKYGMKIGNLAFNYTGLKEGLIKEQIIAQIVADTGLTGDQATQLEQDLRNKFESIVSEAEKNTAGKLADFVVSDLKKAMNGTLPKQKTYVEELMSALMQKAKEVTKAGKETQKQAPTNPIDAIKMALEAIQNGSPDANIWNDAVDQVKKKIAEDNTLSQQDKDDLNLYLSEYTSFVYDNMLNDSVIFKAIKENLIANGYGKGNTANFRALITEGNKAEMFERQRLIEKIKNDLAQYDPVQVEKILDIVAERYQKLINEKRKEIANAHIDKLMQGKSEKAKRAVRGKVGQLLMENRMGIFDDSNSQILDIIAESKGLRNMTSEDWVKIKEYGDLIESLPLGSNLQNQAIEEMTAFVRTKLPARWVQIATAIRYGTLLGRITSNIKNTIGGIEQALSLAGGRALRGDTEFFKAARRGFFQGDFRDILLGGGINQASKVNVEADNNGMPHFRILEYLNPSKGIGKIIESVKYSGRMLDAMDAVWQKFFTSGYDIKYMRKLYELQNPNATKAEIDAKINELLSKERFEDYYDQAVQDVAKSEEGKIKISKKAYEQAVKDVIASGKKVTPARVRRRTYEIMRESLIDPMARDLADLESMEKTYKTDFLQNFGLATGAGNIALATANLSKKIVEPLVERIMKARGETDEFAKEQAKIYGSIIPNFVLPFSKGLSGFIEKGLEKELVYGLAKAMTVTYFAKKQNPTSIEEKMAQFRAFEKAKDIASTAVFTNLILYGVGAALYALSKQWDDDEEKEGRYHPKTGVYGASEKISLTGTSTVKEKAEPENSIVIFGKVIPLSYLGGFGVAANVDANIRKGFSKDIEQKKTKDGELLSSFVNSLGYLADSFLSQSFSMQTAENKSIYDEIKSGNTEKALNIMENTMINYMGSYMPWSGFINQSIQGTRAALGGETYQEAKTTSEKIQKQFGLAGVTYSNTKKNYLGEDMQYADVNREGIVGMVNMFKTRNITAEDNWLRNIGFKDRFVGQYAKTLQDLDGYSPSVQEYDNYTDRNKVMFGLIAKEAYKAKSNIIPDPDEINPSTKKPYTIDEWQSKVMQQALSAVSKYNLVKLKEERGDYNSDQELYEEEMESAVDNFDSVFDIIYDKKGVPYKETQKKIDELIDKVTEVK